jgi:hypothetical protein
MFPIKGAWQLPPSFDLDSVLGPIYYRFKLTISVSI